MTDIDTILNSNAHSTPPIPPNSSRWGTLALMAGVIALTVVVGIAFMRQNSTLSPGKPVPQFTMTTFEGEEVSLEDLRGQIVVLNFWASWCAPCHDEAPDLQYIHETYAPFGVVLVGLAYAEASNQDSIDFIHQYGITYLNAPDRGTRVSRQYGITGVPETFIIDRDGNLAAGGYFSGPVNAVILSRVLDGLLSN
jgi:cytochrome c biogenesis protein CcmG/thiol:disulfide interchange protein DsbE